MLPGLRKSVIAMRLLLAGDFAELLNRLRVAVLGNRSIAFPDLPALDSRPGQEPRVTPEVEVPASADGPVKCIMFAHNLNYEGAPVSQFDLTRALMERGIIIPDVIAFLDGPLRTAYESIGIAVTVIPSCLERIPTLSRLQLVVDELAALIKARRAAVVYANTLLTFAAILAAHEAGVPSIWNLRESEPWETCFGFLPEAVAKRALTAIALPHQVVFVADATRRIWARFDVRGNFNVIHNALDPRSLPPTTLPEARQAIRRRLGHEKTDVVFLCVGTLCQRKGQRDLVQAFGLLRTQIAAVSRLCLVGEEEPSYAQLLQSDIGRLPSDRRGRVSLHRATRNVHEFFAAADVFVLCSRVESYPRVVLEAMAHGLPVIASPVFGVREQLTNGVNAIFFEPGEVEKLASSMTSMITDRELRGRLARESRTGFDTQNSFAGMVERYGAVFRRACHAGL